MGHYEQRLEADKNQIRDRVAAVSERVREAVAASVEALLTGDRDRSYAIILGDLPINREIRAIDARCHAFVARHLPSAGHLRFVSSTMRMTVAIERVGDYAVTIAREAVQLTEPPPEPVASHIRELAVQAVDMYTEAMRAFIQSDAELARETKPLAGSVHRSYDRMFRALVDQGDARPIKDLFAMLAVFNRIERVSDQAKNICEETLFAIEGETKPPKVYRILFLDDDNTLLGPLATAIARKSFTRSGVFQSAGCSPGQALAKALEAVADELGLELDEAPRPMPPAAELAKLHVIVTLSPNACERLPEVPFHTVLLQWDSTLGHVPRDADPKTLIDVSRRIAPRIRELMVTLRGEDAD